MNRKYQKNSENIQKRDASSSKKIIKIALIVIASALALLLALAAVLPLIEKALEPEVETSEFADYRFYEADYNANILENELYLNCSRGINFSNENTEYVLNETNSANISPSAKFFYNYINCIINGDYESYPSFFTEEYINNDKSDIPEKFTMQGLYDIYIDLYAPATRKVVDGVELSCEVYEVRYRIFENNGTFRRDILPDETRTIVFELYIPDNGEPKINAIGFRTDK